MNPDISVIIPTYMRPEKLARALTSVEAACSLPYEVLVIDDCPDGSAFLVAMQFNAQYCCKAGNNRGLAASRNIGITLAKGKYILFLDDDDFLASGSIDALSQALRNGLSFAYGDNFDCFVDRQVHNNLSQLTYDHLLICNRIPVGSYLIERSSIKRNFDERMRSHEDWEFLLNNLEWERSIRVPIHVVTIDKTENLESSMQARRRKYFYLDYISIYSRYPAPHLTSFRQAMLQTLGISIASELLGHKDVI